MATSQQAVIKPFQYPRYYKGLMKIESQIIEVAKLFDLESLSAFEYVMNVVPKIKLRSEVEGWFAFPSTAALARKFFPEVTDPAEQNIRAIELLFDKLVEQRRSKPTDNGLKKQSVLKPTSLQMGQRTVNALATLSERQPGDIFIVGCQAGKEYGNETVQYSREEMVCSEFGAHTVAGITFALTHRPRFESHNSGVTIPGEKIRLPGTAYYDLAPVVFFYDIGGCEYPCEGVCVTTHASVERCNDCAPLTFFLP